MGDSEPFIETLQIKLEDFVCKIDVSGLQQVVQLVTISGKTIDVGLEEIQLL